MSENDYVHCENCKKKITKWDYSTGFTVCDNNKCKHELLKNPVYNILQR